MESELSLFQRFIKRTFDFVVALLGLLLLWWLIVLAYIIASIDTHESGFFMQKRVGKGEALFSVIKIKTMRSDLAIKTTVTKTSDSRITKIGAFFRRTKIDELPQLFNVLIGNMSLVGPRPDVPGFADKLGGEERKILTLRPGITGPATLYYKNEEELLQEQENPEQYNRELIFPMKVKINLSYIENYSFSKDLLCIFATLFSGLESQIVQKYIDV